MLTYEHKTFGHFQWWIDGVELFNPAKHTIIHMETTIDIIDQAQVIIFSKSGFDKYTHINKVNYDKLTAYIKTNGRDIITFGAERVDDRDQNLSVYAQGRLERDLANDMIAYARRNRSYIKAVTKKVYLNDARSKIAQTRLELDRAAQFIIENDDDKPVDYKALRVKDQQNIIQTT